MRYFKIITLIVFLAGVIYSCKESEFASIEDQKFVAFASNSFSVGEASATSELNGNSTVGASTVQVSVLRSSSDLSNSLTVTISATAVYLDQSDFADQGDDASNEYSVTTDLSSVVIPAGSSSATFSIITVNDLFPKGDKQITLEITGVSDNSYSIGNATLAKAGVATVTLVDDDCPIDLASFEGEYSLASFGTENSCCPDFDLCAAASRDCSGTVTLTADPSDPTGTSAILDHPSFTGSYGIKFITCPEQVEVVTPLTAWFGIGWTMAQGPTLGTYNPDTKDITIIGLLGGNGEFTMELKKVN